MDKSLQSQLEEILGSKAEISALTKYQMVYATPSASKITFKKTRSIPEFKSANIEGYSVSGSDVDEAFVTFSIKPDAKDVLAFSELPLLVGEVKDINIQLAQVGSFTTAIHNHWLDISPFIIYLHWIKKGDAIAIAKQFAPIWKKL